MKKKISSFILSLGGIGFLPYMPGTFGSLAVIPFLIILSRLELPTYYHLTILLICTLISTLLIKIYQEETKEHDASMIVMDEVLGMYTGWIMIKNPNFYYILALFLLFRFFDITKIWPASYFDKQKNSFSVIADDLIAGFFSGAILYLYSTFS